VSDESDLRDIRVAKLEALKAAGNDPYAVERFDATHTAAQIVSEFEALEEQPVVIAGRLLNQRGQGKVIFADFRDSTGSVQLFVAFDGLGEEAFESFRRLDIGDIVGIHGTVFRTRRGEISVRVAQYTLLAKCLRPLPLGKEYDGGRAFGLTDIEQRHRMRYVDMLVNPEVRDTLVKRCRVVQATRRFLDARGFLEVETPVLQEEAGGAAARPFLTHHNALDHDFKLRISLELPLKRLIVGGLDRVYEIGRVFRNEGISPRHNPEFTLMELYQAYGNLDDMMELVESMYVEVASAVNGSPQITCTDSTGAAVVVDLSKRPWRRLPILDGIEQYGGVHRSELETLESAKAACARVGIDPDKENTVGGIIEKMHELFTQPHLIEPTFVTDFPIETSPLAKKMPGNPALTRRFEVYLLCQELGNAFSEINDPIDQRERFENQLLQAAAGDAEAHPMDEDFIRALEYGMPPTGGLGVGMDRLAMVLTGAPNIREIIFFPLLKPERHA
jgi:lysyl-tRNA synthetase class 2